MLCFVHIPKAGGTTLNYTLKHSLGYRFLTVEPWVDIRRLLSPADLQLVKNKCPWVCCISSHFARAYTGLEHAEPNLQYFTILRQPIDRYISAFYHRKDLEHRVCNIYEYLNNASWNNTQTKYIAGSDDVEAAKQILREKFAFVGLLDRMDEGLVMLHRFFPTYFVDIHYGTPKNVRRPRSQQGRYKEQWETHKDWALANNASDIELHRFVVEELYPEQEQRYGPTLQADLSAFKEANRAVVSQSIRKHKAGRIYYRLQLLYYRRYGYKKVKVDNGELSMKYDFFGEYVF